MINQNLLLTGDDGYNLTNSLRFRSSASAYLSRTFPSAGNQKTYTLSLWVKRGILGGSTSQFFFGSGLSTTAGGFYFTATDNIEINPRVNNTNTYITTTQVFRDPSAWYHIVVAIDTTQATDSNRLKLYVNGVQVTALSAAVYPALNGDSTLNNNIAHWIGRYAEVGFPSPFDGYLAEYNFIDGQALTPSSFGQTSSTTGVWIPKKFVGTYGTNGFYLPFTDNSALTTSSNVGLGKDFSGNANYWTTNNISITSGSTYDSMTDVPTLTSATAANYAVMNPLNSPSSMTPSSGNLNVITSGVSVSSVSTIAVNSGKWYCEITIANVQDSTILGIAPSDRSYLSDGFYSVTGGVAYYQDGTKFISGSQTSYGASYTTNDVIGIALDMDAGTVTFYKNNTSQGTAASGLTGGYYFAVGDASSGSNTSYNVNFGQRPFTYTPPTGFVALNTFNLPTPTIGATASTTANKYMDATLYTGNGSTNVITNASSFQPDFVWCKSRSASLFHGLYDSVRGAGSTKGLYSNDTVAEGTYSAFQNLVSFNSNGFTLGATSSQNNINENGTTFVGWQWRASNATAVTNTAGSITSTVSANTSAGFSIVTYTGTGANATVGHGLGVAPSWVIVKNRTTAGTSWNVYHISTGNTGAMFLESTAAFSADSTRWNNTTPTSTVFSIGSGAGVNQNTNNLVAYCFAQIAGYSAFGSYTGNGSTDGPFIYTGFRPKFLMVKRTDTTANWIIDDSTRNPSNIVDLELYPSLSNAESSDPSYDFLSNGFKLRVTSSNKNASGGTYIYMAFCESPFKYSNAR